MTRQRLAVVASREAQRKRIARSMKDIGHRWYDPSRDWTLAVMGRYPKPQRVLIELVSRFARAFPFPSPRKYFRWPDRDKKVDELHRAAGIAFVAEKIAT